jgi:hypothetical protein
MLKEYIMFLDQPKPREYLHTKRCYARALICALENLRDNEGVSDHEFASTVQTPDSIRFEADMYLYTGTCSCTSDCDLKFARESFSLELRQLHEDLIEQENPKMAS